MEEILPGVFHWTAFHERIRQPVSSYYIEDPRVLLDPMLPEEGTEWFEGRSEPGSILLTNRHHYRHSDRFVDAFGCEVLCHEAGLHEFEGGPPVSGFRFGDEVAPGIVALEVDAICDEETALHVSAEEGLLAFADGLTRSRDGSLGFVPDAYIGDDPAGVKRELRSAFRRLIERDFDALLFAHGEPLVGGGRAALKRVAGGDD